MMTMIMTMIMMRTMTTTTTTKMTMTMMICDLIRQEAGCGFPMVATACQGLGSAIANCGHNLFYQGCDHDVHYDHDDYQTISIILMLTDSDDADGDDVDKNIIVVEGCFLRAPH